MANSWGSPEAVVINGRRFTCDADTSCELVLSGFSTEKKANGDGTSRNLMTRKLGKISGLALNIDVANADMEFLQECSDSLEDYTVSLTLVSGDVYGGEMHITGDLSTNAKEGTCEVTLEGILEYM